MILKGTWQLRRLAAALWTAGFATALFSSGGTASAAGAPSSSGELIFFARQSPTATLAVRPDGTGLTDVGCGVERTHSGAPRRVLRLEPTGDLGRGYMDQGAWASFAAGQIVSRDEACGDPQVLWAPGPTYALFTAAWSNDDRRVAISGSRFDGRGEMIEQGIWVGEADGSCGTGLCQVHLAVRLPLVAGGQADLTGVVPYMTAWVDPSWAADGRHLVYSRRADLTLTSTPERLFVADAGPAGADSASTDQQIVIAGIHSGAQIMPACSPVAGSDAIAYVEQVTVRGSLHQELFIASYRGGSAFELTNSRVLNPDRVNSPSWSPDGKSVAFTANYAGWGDAIYRAAADGRSKAVPVAAFNSSWNYHVPHWRR